MFAAMHPSGAVAHQCARAVVSLLLPPVAAPVHGGLFHSHTPSKAAAAIATAARLVALRISLRTAVLAHVSFLPIACSPFCVDGLNHVFFARLVSFRTAPNLSEGA